MKLQFLFPLIALGAGCASSTVTGTVDGEEVPGVASAYLVTASLEEVDVMSIVLTTIPDGCEVQRTVTREQAAALEALQRAQQNAANDEELSAANQAYVDEMVRIDRDNLPEEYWMTVVNLFAPQSATLDGTEIDLGFTAEEEEAGGVTGYVQVVHRLKRVDPSEAAVADEDALRMYLGTEGRVVVDRYVEKERIDGKGEVLLKNGLSENGEDAGTIELSFAAELCDLDL